jgi:hypothetical protein
MAKSLLPPEAVMADGVGVEEAFTETEVVPTEPAVTETAGLVAVLLEYTTGAVVGATTLEVVTGLTTVQGQLVTVKTVASVIV